MTFQQFLEKQGYKTRSYSGRGMYGQTCLGIDVSNPVQASWDIGQAISDAAKDAQIEYGVPTDIKYDSMGLDYILYWPEWEYRGFDDDEDEDPEDKWA